MPVAAGDSDRELHAHKWFGAYLYGRKFLEGHVAWSDPDRKRVLGSEVQTGFTMDLTRARREYEIDGVACTEEYFVPDGLDAFTCTFDGDRHFTVEPQFDLRFYRALNDSIDGYETEYVPNGCIVSKDLRSGTYDDRSETFLPDEFGDVATLFAAVQIVGNTMSASVIRPYQRERHKSFSKDDARRSFVDGRIAHDDGGDHAPLWKVSTSTVYAPIRFHFQGHATVVYGFGASREEALTNLTLLRDEGDTHRARKSELMKDMLRHARFQTGSRATDTAYAQVLSRLMNVLVARETVARDTALSEPTTMILAGNGYFHDSWKRDENIALGFLLTLGYYDLARDVIRGTWQLQDDVTGRLPQRIRAGEKPPYHSSDGTLWALWRLHSYWRCTGDDHLLEEILPMVRLFFERSLERTVGGLLPSGRTTDPDYLWETWMDTPHTPRHGFPIEIQMLWLAALRVFRPILHTDFPELEAAMRWAEVMAGAALKRYLVRGIPADGLDEDGQIRDLITPNPYFCFEVGVDLGTEVENTMRHIGRTELAGAQGIVTLAPTDWSRVFSKEFLQDPEHVCGRRMQSVGKFNYHRGVEWNWLAQFFVQSELKYGEPDIAYCTYLRPQTEAVLQHGGVGGISELFDLSGTRGPDFQTWSMSGFLQALHAFAGVSIDVPSQRVTIEPQLPSQWPTMSVRKWYGAVPFDLEVHREGDTQTVDVTFPSDLPDIEVEIDLVLPEGFHDAVVSVEGASLRARPVVEHVPGTARAKVCVRTSASECMRISATPRLSTTEVDTPSTTPVRSGD